MNIKRVDVEFKILAMCIKDFHWVVGHIARRKGWVDKEIKGSVVNKSNKL